MSARVDTDERTHLYRAFDERGVLLYIGIGRNWARRWVQHAERAPFYDEVCALAIETYDSRDAALEAERKAIRFEHPLHNRQHNTQCADPNSEAARGDRAYREQAAAARLGSLDASEQRDSLVGLFFHAHPQRWQGRIVGEPSVGVYMVELFDWIVGNADCQLLVSMSTMLDGHWRFYDTAAEMREEYEYRTQALWDRLDAQATR